MKKIFSKLIALMLVLVMVVSIGFTTPVEAAVKVSKVTVTNSVTGGKTVNVGKGKTIKLKTSVKVSPNKSANKKVTYKSSNPKVATVTSKGVVKGVKAGKATITVTSKKNPKKKAKIKVQVYKKAVSAVAINKPASTTVYTGKCLTLSTTLKPASNIYKTLKWTSSNSAVATVSNGVVKAVKPGTATITAATLDGSKKKSSITITVMDEPINLLSATVLNNQEVVIKLSKPVNLSVNDISIYSKMYSNGQYNRKNTIADVIPSSDKKTYSITLAVGDYLEKKSFVKVSIPKLTGTKEVQAQYNSPVSKYQGEYFISGIVGQPLTGIYDSLYFGNAIGTFSQVLTGLPSGISYQVKYGRIMLVGKPNAAGVFKATYTAKDEMGNIDNRDVYFVIGDANKVVATGASYHGTVSDYYSGSARVIASGGSGTYTYSLGAGETYGCTISGNTVTGRFSNPGTYKIPVVVKDSDGKTANTYVSFYIKKTITVAGIVTDANGNPLYDADVYFENINEGDLYCEYKSTETSSNGSYSVTLAEGTYNIFISYSVGYDCPAEKASATKIFTNQKFTDSKSGYDVKLPLYKVSFTFPNGKDPANTPYWTDSYGFMYGRGKEVYLRSGTYSLSADYVGETFTDFSLVSAKFTVTNKPITVQTTGIKKVIPTISLGQTYARLAKGGNVTFTFTADKSGIVTYKDLRSSYSTNDIEVNVYKAKDGSLVKSMDDGSTFNVTAGEKYYVSVVPYSSGSFTYAFSLSNVSTSSDN